MSSGQGWGDDFSTLGLRILRSASEVSTTLAEFSVEVPGNPGFTAEAENLATEKLISIGIDPNTLTATFKDRITDWDSLGGYVIYESPTDPNDKVRIEISIVGIEEKEAQFHTSFHVRIFHFENGIEQLTNEHFVDVPGVFLKRDSTAIVLISDELYAQGYEELWTTAGWHRDLVKTETLGLEVGFFASSSHPGFTKISLTLKQQNDGVYFSSDSLIFEVPGTFNVLDDQLFTAILDKLGANDLSTITAYFEHGVDLDPTQFYTEARITASSKSYLSQTTEPTIALIEAKDGIERVVGEFQFGPIESLDDDVVIETALQRLMASALNPLPVNISAFDTKSWAIADQAAHLIIGIQGSDYINGAALAAGGSKNLKVFAGDGDDTVTDSSGDDFIMVEDGADTLNTSSGADLIYKAGSGSLTINASPDGVWGHGYYAQNVGLANSIGTENLISLTGLNRFHDTLALGDSQIDVTVNASLPTNATTGLAVFTEDVFSPRHSDVNTIAQFFTDSDIEIPAGLRSFSSVTPESRASFTINGSELGDLFDFTTELITAGSPIDGYQINYFGHGGDDVIWGSAHANIDGGAGDDIINGGYGDNTLTGGSGSDIFEFTATSGNDTITDFNKDEDELHFYFREGEAEETAVASINNGVVTWDAVTVDLGDSSLAISDLNITYEMI
jgi:hypothetical protein